MQALTVVFIFLSLLSSLAAEPLKERVNYPKQELLDKLKSSGFQQLAGMIQKRISGERSAASIYYNDRRKELVVLAFDNASFRKAEKAKIQFLATDIVFSDYEKQGELYERPLELEIGGKKRVLTRGELAYVQRKHGQKIEDKLIEAGGSVPISKSQYSFSFGKSKSRHHHYYRYQNAERGIPYLNRALVKNFGHDEKGKVLPDLIFDMNNERMFEFASGQLNIELVGPTKFIHFKLLMSIDRSREAQIVFVTRDGAAVRMLKYTRCVILSK